MSASTPAHGEAALVHIETVINAGGQIMFATIVPIHGAAVAHDGKNTLVMLRRRPDESAASLLTRLDVAIATSQTTGSRVDEINSATGDRNYEIANPAFGPAVNAARR